MLKWGLFRFIQVYSGILTVSKHVLICTQHAKDISNLIEPVRTRFSPPHSNTKFTVTLLLVTICVDDKFEMFMTDLRCWWPINYNIIILSPTSEIDHHHKVINIKSSTTSLSPERRQNYPQRTFREYYWNLSTLKNCIRKSFRKTGQSDFNIRSYYLVKYTFSSYLMICSW